MYVSTESINSRLTLREHQVEYSNQRGDEEPATVPSLLDPNLLLCLLAVLATGPVPLHMLLLIAATTPINTHMHTHMNIHTHAHSDNDGVIQLTAVSVQSGSEQWSGH